MDVERVGHLVADPERIPVQLRQVAA